MLAIFVLFLREGLEASLIISILFAVLRQLGQMHQARSVWTGVGLAVLASLLGGLAIYLTIRTYDGSTFQTIFETITFLVAVVLLTTMTFWMQRHSRTLKKEITAKASVAGSGFAMGLLAFSSVGREGLESAVFTLAFAFQTNGLLLLTGALLGIAASIGLCVLIYRMGYRLDYRLFFRVMYHPARLRGRSPWRRRPESAGARLAAHRHPRPLEHVRLPLRGQRARR